MADMLSRAERTVRMRSVKQQGTALELLVRKELHRRGLRYRLGGYGLPGRPDIVFPGRKVVIFVHGCFWHAHNCRLGRRPSSNIDFWEQKAIANKERDARKEAELTLLGWRVFTVWQCQVQIANVRNQSVDRLYQLICGAVRRRQLASQTSQ
jgi:DNA mismatch endonuclease, patch repair protein